MTKHWTEEEGIPHKGGMVRFFVVGTGDMGGEYLGWFDMNDWDEGWKKVWEAALKRYPNEEAEMQVLRYDQLQDLIRNAQYAIESALEDKDETTW